ncbi:MAG: NAD(P)/FAD-dependent oxidoreductase [Tissierellaceae bacterium]|nr:NAD(P)/FAD-dependent oxidoreductase [Tissierellaceae bacterium]
MNKKVCVIGAGPAGIIASSIASSRGLDVTLLEKNNKIGKKLFITGKGRCNITNAAPIDEFFENIITNRNFLYSSLYSFTNEDMIAMLNKYGLETKVERGNRIFPKSDKSSDVIKTLDNLLKDSGVNLKLNVNVRSVFYKDNVFYVYFNDESIEFDALIIATGGKSYPVTGSTGDGYEFAKKLGHTIKPLKPSLVPIEIEEVWIKDLQGLSLKNVNLNTFKGDKLIHSEFGEMIFTHYGVSGPIVLTTSNYLNKYNGDKIRFEIDFKPALDFEKLDNRILRDFELFKNKHLKNSLDELLPQRIIPWVIKLSKVDPDKSVNQITKEERYNLVKTIKSFPLTFKSFRPIEEAIVTSGGVSTKEINPSTMESKLVPNLYFAGEIIDVDALTGGFNLQIAYSTGYLSGMNV